MAIFHLTVFCLVSLMLASYFPNQVYGKTITEELKDFCNIIPTDQMKKIAEEHIKHDDNFNEAVIFLKSDKWANMLKRAEQNPEWLNLKKHLEHLGLNLDHVFQTFLQFLATLQPVQNVKPTTRSLRWFFDDVEMILPIGKLLAMLHEKKQKSVVFQQFYKDISSPEIYKMFEKVRTQPAVEDIMNELKAMGARVDIILEMLYGFMNWDSPKAKEKRALVEEKKILMKEFDHFVSLIPWEQLKNITDKHLANDKEFRKAVLYMQSKEFSEILMSITITFEYKELRDYLETIDIDIDKIFRFFHDQLMKVTPVSEVSGDVKENSLKPYLDEIGEAVPIAELFLLLEKKMNESPEFNKFVKKLSDKKIKIMVENLIRLPETIKFLQKLQHMGVKVRHVFLFVYAYLGWGIPFLFI